MQFPYFLTCKETDFAALQAWTFKHVPDSDRAAPGPTASDQELVEPLPSLFTLRPLMSPVKDQLRLGTCVPFSITACLEFVIKNGYGASQPDPRIDLSEGHAAHVIETLWEDCLDNGMSIGQGFNCMCYNGIVRSRDWKYNDQILCHPNPPNLTTKTRYRSTLVGLEHLNRTADQVRTVLADYVATGMFASAPGPGTADLIRETVGRRKSPCIISIPVFFKKDGFAAGWETGHITMPTPAQAQEWLTLTSSGPWRSPVPASGWHAVPICGYDDRQQRFLFKNSWGSWGDRGYGTLPYEYADAFAREIWGIAGGYRTQVGPSPGGI
jgi:C1A family cysteine protease